MKHFKLIGILAGLLAVISLAYFEYIRRAYVVTFENREDVVGIFYSCSRDNLMNADLLAQIFDAPMQRVEDVRGVSKVKSGNWIKIIKRDGREYSIEFTKSPTNDTNYKGVVLFSGQVFKTFDGTNLFNSVEQYCKSKGSPNKSFKPTALRAAA